MTKQPKPCLNCGFPHTRKGNYCSFECGAEQITKVAKQLHEKKGSYYEKWKCRWQAATGLKLKGE